MARRKTRTLTELELEIMQAVWRLDGGEATVEDVHRAFAEAGKPLALPSIRTMLGILQDKGYLTRRPVGRAFTYRPTVSEEQARERILKDVIDRAFDGSALSLVAALVGGVASKGELRKVRSLIRRAESGEQK